MKSMKSILLLFFAVLSVSAFSQIQQNVNKTTGTVSKPITQIDSIRFNTNTNQMEIIQSNGNAENHTISDINNVTFSGQLIGTISSLDCISASVNGALTAYSAASGVSVTITYTGGNGLAYNGQTVSSTGVTGLTASLPAGTFAVGAGTLTYTISGTPNSGGTASFTLTIGGQTCIITINVDLPIGTITVLDCGNATNTGTLIDGTAASGVSSSIPYMGGNGGTHNGQTVTSTGVTGLTANLTAGLLSNGNGSLNFVISGTPNAAGTASFLVTIGGQSCTINWTVNLPVGTISGLNCGSATNIGSLIAYTAASGVSSSVPYTGGNGGTHNGQTITSTVVTGLTATLATGTFALGSGNLIYTITGTPTGNGTASFALNIGGKTCVLSRTVNLPIGTITVLSCVTATNTGTLTSGTSANGVSSSVPYTGGNGGTHNGQTVTSTGVTGLTATLAAGTFAVGSGSLTYTITGTPSTSGTASFALNIGGQTCTLSLSVLSIIASQYPAGSVFCASGPTEIVDVTLPLTGRIWMDRNLGASQVYTFGSVITSSYGDLYQWGRRSDGHQCRTSPTTATLSSVDQPVHGSFIRCQTLPYDWRSPQNGNLWQGVNGVNNPCPIGYRLPSEAEWEASAIQGFSSPLSSPLNLTMAGRRTDSGGAIQGEGTLGSYWSSTASDVFSRYYFFTSTMSFQGGSQYRARGSSVRCIKN